MKLHNLKPAAGANGKEKRIGRGEGSGHGGTSTKGHKGAQSRSGYSKKAGFELKGDVDFSSVAPLCSWITPVPGGVGPMTIAALLQNTLQACLQKDL